MHWPAPEVEAAMMTDDKLFLRELREEMHTLAQPLMLLQARLEVDALTGASGAGRDTLIASLSADAERACLSFRAMQQLVARFDRNTHAPAQSRRLP